MAILPLAGYYTFTQRFPLLPSWYTEYYTQEDRLKQVALILQRQTEWTGLAMDKVNEVVDVLNETGQVDISDFLNQINTVAGNIETIFNELETIEELISEVDGKTTANTDKISSLNTQVLAINSKIVQVEELISNNSSSISSVSGRVSTLETNLSDLNTRTTSVEGSVSAVNTELESISQDISNIQDAFTTIDNSVSDLTTRVDSLENSSGGGVDPALEGRVETIETTVGTHTDDIADLNARVDTLESSSGEGGGGTDPALEGRVETLETNVGTVMNDVSGLNTRVDTLESSSGGGNGPAVHISPDYAYNGINIHNGITENYFTIGSFGGTIDVSLEEDPIDRNGYRINLETNSSGGGESGGSNIVKQFGKELSPGVFSLLKNSNITEYEEVNTEYGVFNDGSSDTLYGTLSTNNLYVYDSNEDWVIGQSSIMQDFHPSVSFTGRYIPLIMDGNVHDSIAIYWDGEVDGFSGSRVYKMPIDLAFQTIPFEQDTFTINNYLYDKVGRHSVYSMESTSIRTSTATYSAGFISFCNYGTSMEQAITAIKKANLEEGDADIEYGKLIIGFTK